MADDRWDEERAKEQQLERERARELAELLKHQPRGLPIDTEPEQVEDPASAEIVSNEGLWTALRTAVAGKADAEKALNRISAAIRDRDCRIEDLESEHVALADVSQELREELRKETQRRPYGSYSLFEICDHRLRGSELRLLLYVRYRQGRSGQTWVNEATIATHLGLTRRHVREMGAALRANGFLQTRWADGATQGRGTLYFRSVPASRELYADRIEAFAEVTRGKPTSEQVSKLRSLDRPDLADRRSTLGK